MIQRAIYFVLVGLWVTVMCAFAGQASNPNPTGPARPSDEIQSTSPPTSGLSLSSGSFTSVNDTTLPLNRLFKQPVSMKLLVLSADGKEPSFAAITFFLDHLGIPYDAVILTKKALPTLNDAARGFYQGIVLATGNLSYDDGKSWVSALNAADWANLDTYQRDYGVRAVSYFTYPEARYGLAPAGNGVSYTPDALAKLSLTADGASIFPYLIPGNRLDLANAYFYPATPVAASGETTTPIITIATPGTKEQTAGVTHSASDGRESLAMTVDSNTYLTHSLALNYGIFNWVTKGVFIGQRKIYITPQIDNYFLANDMFDGSTDACKPTSFNFELTSDPSLSCPTDRIASTDLFNLIAWQRTWQANVQFKDFRLTQAFSGFGATNPDGSTKNDSLTTNTWVNKDEFFWLNNTWDHQNLDCFNPDPGSGICVPANYEQSLPEVQRNVKLAQSMGIPYDKSSVATPSISGLGNRNFLLAAQASGIKYLASDMSRPDWLPALPNTGVRSPNVPSILYVPRRATNIFYNTKSPDTGVVGSLTDEYNYFYGPNGLQGIGGPGGVPFFSTDQTYDQIIDNESNTLLSYMLRGEWYPLLFFQSNLIGYSGNRSLFTDLMDETLNKFARMSKLPVSSLTESTIGSMMEDRMAFNAAGVDALYIPNRGVTLTAKAAAKVPVTGLCAAGCSTYGGLYLSAVPVTPGASVLIPIQ